LCKLPLSYIPHPTFTFKNSDYAFSKDCKQIHYNKTIPIPILKIRILNDMMFHLALSYTSSSLSPVSFSGALSNQNGTISKESVSQMCNLTASNKSSHGLWVHHCFGAKLGNKTNF
jgi:hypothetical protein